jgi:hypothetical protein
MSEAPQEYHLWTGLTIISSVLKRQVYKDRKRFITWPNLYTFLVGPPGTKKSSAISIGEDLLKQTQDPPYIIDTFYTAPFLVSTLAAVTAQYNPGRTPFIILADEAPAFFRRAKYAEDLIQRFSDVLSMRRILYPSLSVSMIVVVAVQVGLN